VESVEEGVRGWSQLRRESGGGVSGYGGRETGGMMALSEKTHITQQLTEAD